MDNMSNEWLQTLKVGDACFRSDNARDQNRLAKVVRLTATMIVVTCGKNVDDQPIEYRHKRDNGYSVGGDAWHGEWLRPYTQENLDAYELAVLKSKAARLRDRLTIPNDLPTLKKLIVTLETFVK